MGSWWRRARRATRATRATLPWPPNYHPDEFWDITREGNGKWLKCKKCLGRTRTPNAHKDNKSCIYKQLVVVIDKEHEKARGEGLCPAGSAAALIMNARVAYVRMRNVRPDGVTWETTWANMDAVRVAGWVGASPRWRKAVVQMIYNEPDKWAAIKVELDAVVRLAGDMRGAGGRIVSAHFPVKDLLSLF